MLELFALVVLFIVLDMALGGSFLLEWLGLTKQDSKWVPNQESPADKNVVIVTSFGADRDEPEGTVELNGVHWTARAANRSQNFDEGDKAKVVQVDGLSLIVEVIDD